MRAIGLIVLLALTVCTQAQTLIFQDDFNEFDVRKWQHQITMGGGGNWEFEWYSNNRSNSYVRDGVLYLKPTLTADNIGAENLNTMTLDIWGGTPADMCTGNAFYGCSRTGGAGGNILNPIQSAAIRTVHTASIARGRVEVTAKLPVGDWLWPAIWMLPTNNQYGNWPASGEIDIMESRGNLKYPGGGVESFGSTLHWGPYWAQDPWSLTHAQYSLPSGTFNDAFHVFGVYWDNTTLYTYLDNPNQKILIVNFTQPFWQRGGFDKTTFDNPWAGRGNNAPFDREFYLIINVAVGGTGGYFPDGVGNKPWNNADPNAVNAFWNAKGQWYPTWNGEQSALQIDSVKMWSLP